MTNESNTAKAMREAAERRIARQNEMREARWMPATIKSPPPKRRRNSVPRRSIR